MGVATLARFRPCSVGPLDVIIPKLGTGISVSLAPLVAGETLPELLARVEIALTDAK
jgi:hypothetical protein